MAPEQALGIAFLDPAPPPGEIGAAQGRPARPHRLAVG